MNPSEIKVYSTVRVVLGEHKDELAVVVGVGNCGHPAHDTIALIFVGAKEQTSPFFIFRFAVELAAQTAPQLAEIKRVRRFNYNNLVTVTDRGQANVGETGHVVQVFDEPVTPDMAGRPSGVFHARYKVEFDSVPRRSAELYDWQLKRADLNR